MREESQPIVATMPGYGSHSVLAMEGDAIETDTLDLSDKYSSELEKILQNLMPNFSLSTIRTVGAVGMILGALGSYEYYNLGSEFGEQAASDDSSIFMLGIMFGVLTIVPNAAINILINKELLEDIISIKIRPITLLEAILIIEKLLVGMHSLVSSFALTMLLLNDMLEEEANLFWLVLLLFSSFISNLFMLYYSEQQFIERIYAAHRTHLLDDHSTSRNRENLLHIIDTSAHSPSEDSLTVWKAENYQLTPATLKFILRQSIGRAPAFSINYYMRFCSIIGGIIGFFSIISYLQIGRETTAALASITNNPDINDYKALETALGMSTFLSLLFNSVEQTSEGFCFFAQQLYDCRNFRNWNALSLFVFIFSAFSSTFNVAIAIRYTAQEESSIIYKAIVLFSAAVAPTLVNNKWFYELTLAAYKAKKSMVLHLKAHKAILKCRNTPKSLAKAALIDAKMAERKRLAQKSLFSNQLFQLRSRIALMPAKQIGTLSFFRPSQVNISLEEGEEGREITESFRRPASSLQS